MVPIDSLAGGRLKHTAALHVRRSIEVLIIGLRLIIAFKGIDHGYATCCTLGERPPCIVWYSLRDSGFSTLATSGVILPSYNLCYSLKSSAYLPFVQHMDCNHVSQGSAFCDGTSCERYEDEDGMYHLQSTYAIPIIRYHTAEYQGIGCWVGAASL